MVPSGLVPPGQMPDHGEHPAMVVLAQRLAQLVVDVRDMTTTALSVIDSCRAIAALLPP